MEQGNYDGWIGRDAYDNQGEKIGEIKDVFYDDVTGRPEWLTVSTGLFKGNTFVPIHGSQLHKDPDGADSLRLNFSKDTIKDAPRIDEDGEHLDPAEEQELWSYYGYDYQADPSLKTGGYGSAYQRNRADKDFVFEPPVRSERREVGAIGNVGGTVAAQNQRVEEHTEEVPVKTTAQVEVPVDTTVRLRRYQTQEQKTRMVEIPYTETTEHTEVADVEARAGSPTTTKGAAQVGQSKPVNK